MRVSRSPCSTASAPRTTERIARIRRTAPMAATPSPRIDDRTKTTTVASRARPCAAWASRDIVCSVAKSPARKPSNRPFSVSRSSSTRARDRRACGKAPMPIAPRQAPASLS